MIDTIVQYLHNARVPFRLASYPSEEPEPKVAHSIPPHGMLIDSRIVLINDQPVLAVFPAGEGIDYAGLGAALGGVAVEGTAVDLPDGFRRADGPIPPLGQLFGMTTVLDERVNTCAVLVFQAFGESDYFDVPYDDYARLEQPRVASFASMGELEASMPEPSTVQAAPPLH